MDRIASLIEHLKLEYERGASVAELRAHLFRIESALMDEGAKTNSAAAEIPIVEPEPVSPQKTKPTELNETIEASSSVNDKLQSGQTEIGASLKKEAVQDLRKAIGVNDRYLFIQELFGGNEADYELAIKTINDFHTLQQAVDFINAKFNFQDSNKAEVLSQFQQLLSRRFS